MKHKCDFCGGKSAVRYSDYHLCNACEQKPKVMAKIEAEESQDADIYRQDEHYYGLAYGDE